MTEKTVFQTQTHTRISGVASSQEMPRILSNTSKVIRVIVDKGYSGQLTTQDAVKLDSHVVRNTI